MDKILRIIISALGLVGLMIGLHSCTTDEPEGSDEQERLILVYAIAANNLQPNLTYDKREILSVAPKLNLRNNAVLVYSVVSSGECVLERLQKNGKGEYEFCVVKQFTDLPLSTDPERITEVMKYVAENYRYEKKGLVLWSHADGWLPWFQGSNPGLENVKKRSFGWDNFEGNTYKTNINALAEAIPAGMFDFIWFDCCYMGNIETIYELRDKTEFVVGSVLEIANDGMPYNLTMPYLLRKEADLKGAAEQFYNDYVELYMSGYRVAVSVSIIDASKLYLLAEAASMIFSEAGQPTNLDQIQTYQRNLSVKFYDMGQLLRSYSNITEGMLENLNEAFSETVIYKKISERDFNSRPISEENYSGLSMHNFTDNGTANDNFYQTLDWYRNTRNN